jgi:hypothetical protein
MDQRPSGSRHREVIVAVAGVAAVEAASVVSVEAVLAEVVPAEAGDMPIVRAMLPSRSRTCFKPAWLIYVILCLNNKSDRIRGRFYRSG